MSNKIFNGYCDRLIRLKRSNFQLKKTIDEMKAFLVKPYHLYTEADDENFVNKLCWEFNDIPNLTQQFDERQTLITAYINFGDFFSYCCENGLNYVNETPNMSANELKLFADDLIDSRHWNSFCKTRYGWAYDPDSFLNVDICSYRYNFYKTLSRYSCRQSLSGDKKIVSS